MLNTHGTYYYKDRYSKKYILVLDGVQVGTVATRKEAEAWFRANATVTA